MIAVVVYLGAIVVANLSAATFGPDVTILNAGVLIGLDLTLRDRLHERWQHRPDRMVALIATGGTLSFVVNGAAGPIALASTVAFAIAATVDAVVFEALRGRARTVRVNGSNVVSAAADSILFPTLAFGALMPGVVLGQFAVKVLGGFVWAMVIRALPDRRPAA